MSERLRAMAVVLLGFGGLMAMLTVPGCGGGASNPETKVGKAKSGGKAGPGEAASPGSRTKKDYKVTGYAVSLKGRVTYNGDATPAVKKTKPEKDAASCPMEVIVGGWDVKESNKGVKWAVVFLKPPKDGRMPKASPALEKADKDVVEVIQPKCQFEPRVLVMHPAQRLVFVNDSAPQITHDSTIKGSGYDNSKTLPPGQKSEPLDPAPSDSMPYKLTCNIHTGTMGAFVWRPNHPYAVVTDADGNYELKGVPVLEGGNMILCVWHEELPSDSNNIKEIGEIDVTIDGSATKDIAIPK